METAPNWAQIFFLTAESTWVKQLILVPCPLRNPFIIFSLKSIYQVFSHLNHHSNPRTKVFVDFTHSPAFLHGFFAFEWKLGLRRGHGTFFNTEEQDTITLAQKCA